jgi:hypothetical protein
MWSMISKHPTGHAWIAGFAAAAVGGIGFLIARHFVSTEQIPLLCVGSGVVSMIVFLCAMKLGGTR